MQSYGKGQELVKHSVNDDLDSFFGDLRPGNGLSEQVMTYFIPKLTEEELVRIKEKDKNYFETISELSKPDFSFLKDSVIVKHSQSRIHIYESIT